MIFINRITARQLLFVKKIITGDFYYVGHFIGNTVTDGFTDKLKHVIQKKIIGIILLVFPSLKMEYHR